MTGRSTKLIIWRVSRLMLFHGATNGVLCRAFPSTLRKAARYKYSSPNPNSMHFFNQLGRSFVVHFVNSRKLHQGSDSLINIKQGEQESLRIYMSRFNVVALKVYNLDHTIAMKYGLQKCSLLARKESPS